MTEATPTGDTDPHALIAFWQDEVGEARWYASDPALDALIARRWAAVWETGRARGAAPWGVSTPEGSLAACILFDQLPRNIHRGRAAAFATDPLGLAAALEGIAAGHDRAWQMPIAQFYYLPLEHAEDPQMQRRCIALFEARGGGEPLLHARAHAWQIEHFGRFPARNAALGRESTAEERAFLEAGGYPALVRRLRDGG